MEFGIFFALCFVISRSSKWQTVWRNLVILTKEGSH